MRTLALVLSLVPGIAVAQSLEIMAPAAPGGGWDQTARALQRVFNEIEPGVSVQVNNVPGAAGTIGLARFIQSERGNPGALMVTGLVMLSGVILNGSPVSLADTTPIARLTGEYEVIVVPASSAIRSIGTLIDTFKRDPGSVSWGGGSAGGTDDLLVRLLAEQAGVAASRVNYIAFSGGGAALAAVLGGQVTAAVSGYAEFAGQIAAGQLRALAISSASRVPGTDAPTLRESGIALDLFNWRAIVGPPGLSNREIDALTARIARVAASTQWRNALAQNGWEDQLLTGAPLKQFLLAEQARIEDVLRRLAASDASTAPALATTITPATLPSAIGVLLLGALVMTGVRTLKTLPQFDRQGVRMAAAIALTLLALPFVFVTIGFVAAATLAFTAVASALRGLRGSRSELLYDSALGFVFSFVLYEVFTRGLGVALPGLAFL